MCFSSAIGFDPYERRSPTAPVKKTLKFRDYPVPDQRGNIGVTFNLFGKRKSAATELNIDDILAEMNARTGAATRAKELPAWALLFRSPYKAIF